MKITHLGLAMSVCPFARLSVRMSQLGNHGNQGNHGSQGNQGKNGNQGMVKG
jgi:hypothetical protein